MQLPEKLIKKRNFNLLKTFMYFSKLYKIITIITKTNCEIKKLIVYITYSLILLSNDIHNRFD